MGDDDAVQSSSPGGPPQADAEPEERARPILTRREFLVGAGAGVAASAAVAGATVAVQSGTRPQVVTTAPVTGGPGPAGVVAVVAPPAGVAGAPAQAVQLAGPVAEKQIALKINGHTYKVVAQARATLADVIRYQIGLTGTKIGCNRAECGACTVIMDGKNVYSCTQMAFASEGKEIMTVEGLASDPSRFEGLHPIQQGFILKDAPQCGFCMSGQMMSAYSLLQAQPKPDFEQIRMGLSGNICRCGNYNHLWDAVAWGCRPFGLEGRRDPTMADTMKYVGQAMPKLDSLARLTGLAQYTDDMPLLPRTAHAMLVHSPYAHARIRSIDSTQTEAVPGVIAVLDYRRNDMNFRWFSGDRAYERLLFSQELRYHGEIVAMVVAEDRYTAEDAVRLLQVDYEVLPHVVDSQEALRPDAPQLHDKGNLVGGKPSVYTRGDVQQGLAQADFVLDQSFETQFQHNAQMEPRVALAMWEGPKLTIWTPTQGVTSAKIGLSQDLGIAQSNVRVICQYMGGGFGQKNGNQNIDTMVAAGSRAIGRPLKLWMGRAGDMSEMHGRWSTKQAYKIGFKKDGTVSGLDFVGFSNIGAWAKSTGAIYGAREMLDVDHVSANLSAVYTNQQNAGNFRAPPDPQGVFSMAQLIDMAAEKLGIAGVDLPEFNIKVATKKADQTDEYTAYLLPDVIRKGADAVGWRQNWHPLGGKQLPDGRWHGLGMAWGTWGAGLGLGSAIVKINADGTAHLLTGVTDIGGGAKTTMVMLAAEVLGIPPDQWQSTWGDTDTTSYSVGDSGSRNTGHEGPAVLAAAADARQKLIEGAVPLLKATSAGELDAADGKIFLKSDPSKSVTYAAVADRSQGSIIGTAFTRETVPDGKSREAWVAGFAEVAVDKAFGKIQVLHYTSVHDSGRIINRLTSESQAHGGITMGIGMALFEELLWDRATGNHLNTNIHDYRVPTHLDIPKIDVLFLDQPDPYGPLGAKPMGEPPIVPVPGAIANAVYNAIGVRMTKLPMNPHNVLAAIGASRTA